MTNWQALSPGELERMALNISPGEWQVDHARPISTLLGSCVAVCLYDESLSIGGMNHFMLPNMKRRELNAEVDTVLSGDYAMEVLLNDLLARGAKRVRIKAKAFGGGTIISGMASAGIGRRNAEFAREWLERERIELVASDFLGPWSRKVIFVPALGDAYCKRIPTTMITSQEVAREEIAYAESLEKRSPGSNVELF